MSRGSQKIKKLESAAAPPVETAQASEGNHAKKTRCIIYRYIYHSRNNPKHEDLLNTLAGEFFITPGRIADILIENSDVVKMARKYPEFGYWKKQYPGFSWA